MLRSIGQQDAKLHPLPDLSVKQVFIGFRYVLLIFGVNYGQKVLGSDAFPGSFKDLLKSGIEINELTQFYP